jgi:hypothetical protein
MTTFLRFDGHLAEDMTFTRRMGWETEQIAHRPHDGDGSYTLGLLNEDRQPLVAVSPHVVFHGCSTDVEARITRVIAYIPLRPEGRELVFRSGVIEIHREPVAAKPPRVRITKLAPRRNGSVELGWEASAPGLTARVVYLAGPRRGFVVVRERRGNRAIVDLSGLPGARGGRLAVLVSDGTRSGSAVSRTFRVPDKAPICSIAAPVAGELIQADQPFSLIGRCRDVAGANLPDPGLRWLIDGEVAADDTHLALAPALQPGAHEIVLQYRLRRAIVATAKVRVRVAPRSREQQRLMELLAQPGG